MPFSVSLRRADAAEVGELWRGLQTRSDTSFFLTWDWIGCWLRLSGAEPWLLEVRQEDAVVGLALLQPASLRRHWVLGVQALMLHQVGDPLRDVITVEYNGLLTDRRCTAAATEAAILFLARQRGPRWDELHLPGTPTPEALRPVAEQAGLGVWYYSYKPSSQVNLQAVRDGGGDYLQTLSANTRQQIRRAARLYAQRGPLAAVAAGSVAEAMDWFEPMKALHQKHWVARGHPGSYAFPFFERFHRALVADCVPRGTVELLRVSAGPDVLGYVYNFVWNGRVLAYHTGVAYEADARLKPGLVCHHLCIERHLRGGAQAYDFLAGDERYKASMGQPGPSMAHVVLQRPRLKLRAEQALRQLKARLRPSKEPVA